MSHHPERTARNVRPVNQPPSFNFKADVSDEFAEKIYQKMKNKKWFVEECNKIIWA